MFARETTLKASLISYASMESAETPACLRALGMASAGAVVNLLGALAASPQPRILAMGLMFSSLSLDSETRTTAAEPSLRGEELGAVTVPVPGMKAGFMALSLSGLSLVEGLG